MYWWVSREQCRLFHALCMRFQIAINAAPILMSAQTNAAQTVKLNQRRKPWCNRKMCQKAPRSFDPRMQHALLMCVEGYTDIVYVVKRTKAIKDADEEVWQMLFRNKLVAAASATSTSAS